MDAVRKTLKPEWDKLSETVLKDMRTLQEASLLAPLVLTDPKQIATLLDRLAVTATALVLKETSAQLKIPLYEEDDKKSSIPTPSNN